MREIRLAGQPRVVAGRLSAIATRASGGTPAGGAKRGLNPPTASTKPLPGPRPPARAQRHRAGERELVRPGASRPARRRSPACPASKSSTPIASRLSRTRSLSRRRQERADRARATSSRWRAPNSRMSAEIELDQRRRDPADPHQQPEQIAAAAAPGRRLASAWMIAGALRHRVAREQQRAQRVVLAGPRAARPRRTCG